MAGGEKLGRVRRVQVQPLRLAVRAVVATFWYGAQTGPDAYVSRMLTYGATCHFIVPELDLVIVTTSGLYGSPRQGNAPLDILASFVIPSIRDSNTR